MAAIPVVPLIMKDVTMKIGADSYEAALTTVTFTPTSSDVVFQGLTPTATFTSTTTSTWQATLTYAQDWASTTSLSRYLYNNEGASVVAVFTPKVGTSAPTFTATIVIKPGSIGGDVNSVATATVTLGVTGKPVLS